ncbi:hypothetical protein M2140_000183 [Clostridiales Family XIII bacterium PM5-7]
MMTMKKKASTGVLIICLLISGLACTSRFCSIIEPVYAATNASSFAFSYYYTKSVNGLDNGVSHYLTGGKDAQLKVTDISGATSSKPISMGVYYFDNVYNPSVYLGYNKIYKTGTYNYQTCPKSKTGYYIKASGGAGNSSKYVSAKGYIQNR